MAIYWCLDRWSNRVDSAWCEWQRSTWNRMVSDSIIVLRNVHLKTYQLFTFGISHLTFLACVSLWERKVDVSEKETQISECWNSEAKKTTYCFLHLIGSILEKLAFRHSFEQTAVWDTLFFHNLFFFMPCETAWCLQFIHTHTQSKQKF